MYGFLMTKFSATDWLDHGLKSLEQHGFTSLKADVLAKSAGVSRGSFYHHFTDLADFHSAVLNHWLEKSSLDIVVELESLGLEPAAKIEALITLAAKATARLEQAVRAWAFTDASVAATVVEVDRARLLYIVQLLGEAGLDEQAARRRAILLYLTNVGYSFLADMLDADEQDQALADVISLTSS